MRIVTRPDFDGVVCAVLLYEAGVASGPILWLEPGEVQSGCAEIGSEDILSNLPYDDRCAMWFDHHFSNKMDRPFKGAFRIAPSAAGVIYDYYRSRYTKDFSELVAETDKIDSAAFTMEEILHPERNPYILLSMTISGIAQTESTYWETLVELLRGGDIQAVIADEEVAARCDRTVRENSAYEALLENHTRMDHLVSITDFRHLDPAPRGNRFMVYSLFPKANVNVCILNSDANRDRVMVKVGHSIFNRTCKVNVGQMLADYDGGGHRGAGSCSFPREAADDGIAAIIDRLVTNRDDSPDATS